MKHALVKVEEDSRYKDIDPNIPLAIHGVITSPRHIARDHKLYLCCFFRDYADAFLTLEDDEVWESFCGRELESYKDKGKSSTKHFMWIRESHLIFIENNTSAKSVLSKFEE